MKRNDKLVTSAHSSYALPVVQFRWGQSSEQSPANYSNQSIASLFERDKKWGAKEWLVVGAVVAAVVVVVILVSSDGDGGGDGGGGPGY